jgi:SAM-dependent methyltransferase
MPRCRLCGAKEERQTIRADHVFGGEKHHKFWHCETCDAVYLFPIPSVKEEALFYKMEFEKFMSHRSGNDRDWSSAEEHIRTNQDQVKRRWRFLKEYLEPGQDLLEIGCSSGFMLNAFRDYGLNCTGIEPSGEFIEFLLKNQHIAFASIEELTRQAPNKQFDLIVHFFVLEHIRDPYQFFTETKKRLKQGGKLIAEVPCVNDPLTSLYNIPAFEKFYWSIAHHYYYSPKSIAFVLDSLGYQYKLIPEQRYDLSNHIVWMTEGKPGGQGKFDHVFSSQLIEKYQQDLKDQWQCDTFYLVIENDSQPTPPPSSR